MDFRSLGYRQAIFPARHTGSPARYPSWFLCHFAQRWLPLLLVTCGASWCLLPASAAEHLQCLGLAVSGGRLPVQVCAILFRFNCLGLGAWGPLGDWRFQVTLFSGPSILQAPGERFPLGGSRLQGCHGYLPFGLWLLLPANLSGTSSQAHLFVMSLNVAKYHLGKVRLKPMQSAVSPVTVRDLRGGPLETCRAIVSHCITRAVLLADRCGSFVLVVSESLRILAPSPPSLLVAGF